jgi:hypothetical protein
VSSYKFNAPACVIFGCGKPASYKHKNGDGTYSYRNFCTKHHKTRTTNAVTKKHYCENMDGHLGFGHCTTTIVSSSQLDIDHVDGDRYNNNPANLRTYCKACHSEKTKRCGDNLVRYDKIVHNMFSDLFEECV